MVDELAKSTKSAVRMISFYLVWTDRVSANEVWATSISRYLDLIPMTG